MDYSLDMAYNNYLLESMLEQSKMETYIQEALILSEGIDIKGRLTALNEGVGGKLKEVWQKFTDFIKRIFAKFTETMTKVLDTDKGWLEKYQDIILKKPFNLDVNCRAYQLDRIIQHQIPIFNYSQLKNRLDSKAVFMNSIISDFPADGNADDLTGWCKAYFCNGKEEEVKVANINMREVYDYCHDFKDITLPKLKQYQSNIEKSAVNANSLISSAISNAAPKAEMADLFAEETAYSRLFGKALNELTINDPAANKTTNAGGTPTGDQSKKFSANVPDGKNTDGGETRETAQKAVADDGGLTEEKASQVINTYTTVAGAITSSAITVAQWAYNDYIKILRAHVKKYVADSDTPNQTPQAAADHRPGQQTQQSQQNQQAQQNQQKRSFGRFFSSSKK